MHSQRHALKQMFNYYHDIASEDAVVGCSSSVREMGEGAAYQHSS